MNRGNKNSGKSHRRKSAKDFIDDMKRLDEDDDGLGGSNRNATEGTTGQEIAMSLNLHIPPNDTDLQWPQTKWTTDSDTNLFCHFTWCERE